MAKRKSRVDQAEIVRAFGVRLRDLRLSIGMTQADLALKAGLAVNHLWRLESGASAPGIDLVERLANVLGVPISQLLPEGGAGDPVAVYRDQAREMFETLMRSGSRDTYVVLNPMLACLVESLKRRT